MKRYVLAADKHIIEEMFGVSSDFDTIYEPNYNVMPGHTMPIILGGEKREIVTSIWGLEPETDESIHEIEHETFNNEDAEISPADLKPCIIPASGFYKWKETVDDPLPFYLRVLTQEVSGLAGFYSSHKNDDGRVVHSFAVVTMPANALVEPLDNRMPVILDPKEYGCWLSGNAMAMMEEGFSGNHLLPEMSVFRVPELVNDPANNSKELIQPIPKLRNYDGEDED